MNFDNQLGRGLRRLSALCTLAMFLAACAVEGGVPEATPAPGGSLPASAAPAATPPQLANDAVATAVALRNDSWAIGLQDAPKDFYPYQPGASAQRAAAPITELLFPSPVLAYNYGYTTTGVLERIPTIENGGATIRKVDVFLDSAGNITTTATQVVTQVDQLVVTYNWNRNLRWSDGTPVTADDSVFAYELAKAAPPSAEARDRLEQTVSYEKVDDHTTRATLRPDYTGPTYFLTYWTPLPRHLLKNTPPKQVRDSPFAKAPVGYGPYAIEGRDGNILRMVRNPYYFGPTPAASRLNIAFLPDVERLRANVLNGNLDAIALDRVPRKAFAQFDADSKNGAAQVSFIPNPVWEHVDFNLDVPALQDIRVRRALALGINRTAIARELFAGHAPLLHSWVLPHQFGAAPDGQLTLYGYSPDDARKLLDEAGYTDPDGDGIRASRNGVTFTLQLLTTANNSVRQEIAERIAADLKAIGVLVEVQMVPPEKMFDPGGPLYSRQFELALFGWGAAPDPGGLSLWSCASVPSENNGFTGENFAGWCFREADQAIRVAATTLDPQKRAAAYLRQQQLWTQEVPSLPLFQRVSVAMARPQVQGVAPDAFAPITWNIANWRRSQP